MTWKVQQNRCIDPSVSWGQNRGSQEAGEQESTGKMGNLDLQKGELPKFSLYCLLMRRWASQGQGNLQMLMKQSNN